MHSKRIIMKKEEVETIYVYGEGERERERERERESLLERNHG
jgi:hypothetical protein